MGLYIACAQLLSCVQLFATLWTVAHQVPLSMDFFRQEYWSGLPYPTPGNFPSSRVEPTSPVTPALQADSLAAGASGEPHYVVQLKLTYCLTLW